ncbi:hypothetical protein [Paraburkholderia tropica]|uniref:hypothetical protein n=1 Tax=Paraburkholderia tropica TaxID=92647 RepID=UPI002AB62FBB|nr:hypothetical protein [Paraburkholderia tropica]
MKYASEIMGLMAPYPGRKFRMRQLVQSIAGKHAEEREKKQVRMGVWRVLKLLEESGHIVVEAQAGRGASASYAWKASETQAKVLHAELENCY